MLNGVVDLRKLRIKHFYSSPPQRMVVERPQRSGSCFSLFLHSGALMFLFVVVVAVESHEKRSLTRRNRRQFEFAVRAPAHACVHTGLLYAVRYAHCAGDSLPPKCHSNIPTRRRNFMKKLLSFSTLFLITRSHEHRTAASVRPSAS